MFYNQKHLNLVLSFFRLLHDYRTQIDVYVNHSDQDICRYHEADDSAEHDLQD